VIEATKEQHREIQLEQAANNEQRWELAKALRQIGKQQDMLRKQDAAMQKPKG
jgi:peptidoglycan hydrolase CwlO-like protein